MRYSPPKKAILIRIGVDQSFGHWNAPCHPENREFVYVPIPEPQHSDPNLRSEFREAIQAALTDFSLRNKVNITLPNELLNQSMHLDPDFHHLTYGDTTRRGKKLLSLEENDWLVFYSGLRSVQGKHQLIYALTGLLIVDSIAQVKDIPECDYHRNAHTRVASPEPADIIVTGKPGVSGRFKQFIDIGEFRNGAYRVTNQLLHAWGDLTVNDGWIQRSANPPLFKQPKKFAQWLARQKPELLASNYD